MFDQDIDPINKFIVFGGTADIWANLQTKFNLNLAAEKTKEFDLKPFDCKHLA